MFCFPWVTFLMNLKQKGPFHVVKYHLGKVKLEWNLLSLALMLHLHCCLAC